MQLIQPGIGIGATHIKSCHNTTTFWSSSLFTSILTIVIKISFVNSIHIYTDSFPTYDEYDFAILDPESIYGSPYGGYSRATRSRLASLPLYLPDILSDDLNTNVDDDDDDDDDEKYMEIRDADGRLFVCRIYSEDELDPYSLEDSMFTAPKLRRTETTIAPVSNSETTTTTTTPTQKEIQSGDEKSVSVLSSDDIASGDVGESNFAVTTIADSESNKIDSMVRKGLAIQSKLNELEGICGQLHKGWWSYEICMGVTISQFHISLDQTGAMFNIEYVTNLGFFSQRNILVNLENEPPNELAEDLPELGRVVDILDNGAMCGETNTPRKSYVHYQCCSRRVFATRQGMIHKDGVQITTDIATVLDVIESQTCEYNATVCTPLLCGDEDDLDNDGSSVIGSIAGGGQSKKKEHANNKPKENETIQEILHRSLGEDCIVAVEGWWTYQFCHNDKIRQYHEELGTTRNENGIAVLSKVVSTEHVLGRYQKGVSELPSKKWGDEWSIVVNSTSDDTSNKHTFIQGTDEAGVTKTYYEVSYVDGDVCDGHDVKDSAIVAGSVVPGVGTGTDGTGTNAALKRSSSVRYYCGSTLLFTVNEDSTCHYVVQLSLPELCTHPLFREPISKKQIMKCLPAPSSG